MRQVGRKAQVKAIQAPAHYGVLEALDGVFSSFAKRAFDLTVASLAIVATLPLMLLIAALIRLEGRGSVIFTQERTGQHAKPFTIFKFRTMVPHDVPQDTPDYVMQEDPRITRIGKILRNTSLDELPQLFNVIKGDLSIVGPRPQPTNYLEIYERDVIGYRQRLSVRPGVTCPVQISPMRQAVQSVRDIQIRTDLEVFYVRHQSFWLDAYICFRTAVLIVMKKCVDIRTLSLFN